MAGAPSAPKDCCPAQENRAACDGLTSSSLILKAVTCIDAGIMELTVVTGKVWSFTKAEGLQFVGKQRETVVSDLCASLLLSKLYRFLHMELLEASIANTSTLNEHVPNKVDMANTSVYGK